MSLGSKKIISVPQMMELAIGLESRGKAFIWVLRPPIGHDVNEDFGPEWLPNGFEDCVKERKQGLLVHKWAAQLDILAHESTGAFLSHCGWNSVIESLNCGVPIIGWPLASEQFYISKMLEELGVCMELARGVQHNVKHQRVESVIGVVMGRTEKGEEMKKNAI